MRTLLTVLLAHTESTLEHGQTAEGAVSDHLLLWRRLRNRCPLEDEPVAAEVEASVSEVDEVLALVRDVMSSRVDADYEAQSAIEHGGRVAHLTASTVAFVLVADTRLVTAGFLLGLMTAG